METNDLPNKVCLVPYVRRGDELHFLIHLPKAKNPAEQDQMMWGLVRGTVELTDRSAWYTAQREGAEEAGLSPEDVKQDSKCDHGIMDYASLNKPPYPLHVFSVELARDELTAFKANATDATDLALHSLKEIQAMAEAAQFKPGYLPILQQLFIA